MSKPPFDLPKLPSKIDYARLVANIAKAHASIARLDGLLSNVVNPRLLSRTFITKEAVMSSQIEGTQATLSEVFEHEAKGIKKENTNKERDFREILNYHRALERGVELLMDRLLSENFIKELHRILLHSTRGHNKAPGEFRRQKVYIGRQGLGIEHASYVPPLPAAIPELFSNLEKYIHSDDEQDVLVQIAVVHYQFEAIHPFMDGNGRIGRLLISLMLYDKKLLSYPYIYLSEFFEEHRQDYYDLLLGVSEKGAWEDWILFFLRGLNQQACKAQETAKKILDLHERVKIQLPELGSVHAYAFFEALFVQPLFSARTIRRLVSVKNAQTIYNLINKFKQAGIIVDLTGDQRRNKIYRFDALHDILKR